MNAFDGNDHHRLQQAHRFVMSAVPIQDQDELTPQVLVEQVKKAHDLLNTEVTSLQLKAQPQTVTVMRQRERSDG